MLFILIFITISFSNNYQTLNDFYIINNLNTQNEIIKNNFIKIIENNLDDKETDNEIIKQKINIELKKYTQEKDIYIKNKITNELEKITLEKLNLISEVLIIKPSNKIIVKKYIITNGISKDKTIIIIQKINNHKTEIEFPQNYSITKVVILE
ncbi:MAG: hypothetical protein PHR26_00775 [Candidatus ainarchaeum sp.]|nr:hypothetical protein [Candidatus ainarchaeum sp.]